ncbi:MAG: guanylate kinase [Defluviitaleaceae bacterium]|nr:guanylate kinase [Defluviitaleaceae bacterium]
MNNAGNNSGMLIIISGPSGSGKGTVVKSLDKSRFAHSVSVTTREKRPGEVEGIDYFFRTMEEFEEMRNEGRLLEHAYFCGNCYGTPRDYVEQKINEGCTVVLEIEVNGALQVREKIKNCVLIFLIPPTMEELARRLVTRNTESPETIEDRLYRAEEEIELVDKYDYLVINDHVADAVKRIDDIVNVESLKPFRCGAMVEALKNKTWHGMRIDEMCRENNSGKEGAHAKAVV